MYGGNLFKFGSTGLFLGSLTNLLLDLYKGQLISEGLFDVIVWTKKRWNFLRISALASKKRSDQKNKGSLYY